MLRFIASHRCCVFLQIEDPPPAKRLRLALLQWPGIKPAVSLKYACTDTLFFHPGSPHFHIAPKAKEPLDREQEMACERRGGSK